MDSEIYKELRILVVDDEEFFQNITSFILDKIGFRYTETASNGHQALDLIDSHPSGFDIILCDLEMPRMDGVEFIRRLSELGFAGGLILLSGHDKRVLDTAKTYADACNLNVLATLPKPFQPETVQSVLKKYTPRASQHGNKAETEVSSQELHDAIESDALHLVFQPQIDVASGMICGVEALVRWNHPVKGHLSPAAFLGTAEKFDLMVPLTFSVYRQAMATFRYWLTQDMDLTMSINIPANAFSERAFCEFLLNEARSQWIPPERTTLEVTEKDMINNLTACMENMIRLRMKGMHLAIDDFGTGHSSMKHLTVFPLTEIKIDRSFVQGAALESSARAVFESSMNLAKKLEIRAVAEGVETREDWEVAKNLGCHVIQGYYCARPMAADDCLSFVQNWRCPHPGNEAINAGGL